jgi:hypothetical protein
MRAAVATPAQLGKYLLDRARRRLSVPAVAISRPNAGPARTD